MLVSNGHGLILKNIIGRIPISVTHMSFGVNWNDGASVLSDLWNRQSMGFEIARVPIDVAYDHLMPVNASDGVDDFQLVYKGELPLNRRVMFNEIGLWCGSSNSRYGNADSKLILTGTPTDNFIYTKIQTAAGSELPRESVIMNDTNVFNSINQSYYTNANFKLAQPRIDGTAIPIQYNSTVGTVETVHIYTAAVNMNLSLYSPLDIFKVAVTWVPKNPGFGSFTSKIETSSVLNITFNFANGTSITVPKTYVSNWENTTSMNCYKILSFRLGENGLTDIGLGNLVSLSFSAVSRKFLNDVSGVTDPVILLDGVRLDRAVNNNPLYGLVFYDYVYQEVGDGEYKLPIEKIPGFDGHMEHRVRLFANDTGEETI